MKRCITSHFARFMHLEDNLQIVKEENKKYFELGEQHKIHQLPSKWQVAMSVDILDKGDSMTTTINN